MPVLRLHAAPLSLQSWQSLQASHNATVPLGPIARKQNDDDSPLLALADAALAGLSNALMHIFTTVGASVPRDQLAGLIAGQDRPGVEQLLQAIWDDLGARGLTERVLPQLRQLALDAGTVTVVVGVEVGFNVIDPEALAAIDAAAARGLVAVSETTREAVQAIVRNAFEAGTPLTQQIAEMTQVVGLTPAQTVSIDKLRTALLEAGEPFAEVERRVAERSTAMRRQRAEVIARTESMAAVNTGAYERLMQSVRSGLLDADRVRRHWLTAQDERTCPLCAPVPGLNPEGVGLFALFHTPSGEMLNPPLHPSCRCTTTTEII